MVAASLLGRVDELARTDALADAIGSEPSSLVLVGEAGIGKSAIWSAAVDRARGRAGLAGRMVLTARAVEAEQDLAHAALADLLGPVAVEILPDLPPPQATGLAAALLLERPTTPVDARLVGTAVLGALERLAADRPVLIAIDDIQWLDSASTTTLAFALRRAWDRRLRVGLLATSRRPAVGDPAGHPLPAWLARLVEPGSVVEVGPASLGVLHELIRERIGLSLTRPQLVRIEASSLGNPLRALEIARALQALDRWPLPGEPLPVPDDIDRLVATRLARLADDDRRALAVVALATDATTKDVAALLDAPAAAARAALDRAVTADLLEAPPSADGPWRFAHPLFRAAAMAATPLERRREIHARLADRTTDDEERARHAALAGDGPDAVAAARIEAGAIAAWRRGAPSIAAELAVVAVERTPPDDAGAAARRRVLAARWLGDGGAVDRARTLLDAAIESMPSGDDRAEAGALAAQMAGWVDGPEALVRRATAALDDARDPVVRARILLRIANEGDAIGRQAALPLLDEAIALLETAGAADADPDLLACALLQSAETRLGLGLADDEASVARARTLLADEPRPRPDGIDRPESFRACELAWIWEADHDRIADAIAGVLREVDRARQRGHDRPMAIIESEVALLLVWAGDLAAADQHARAATDAAALADHPQARAAALSAVAAVALAAGRLDDADAAARAGLEEFPDDGFLADRNRATLGRVALVRGDATAAVAALGALLDAQLARDGRPSLQDRYAADLAEAAAAAGDMARADAAAEVLAAVAATTPRPWAAVMAPRARAIALAARGDLDAADSAIRSALIAAEGLEMPIERARTALIAGRIARRRKERARAGELFDAAAAAFEACGAQAWLAITRAEAGRLGRRAGAGSVDALTDTEEQVARLAAVGRTNREVGEALFLTPKSVEGVLARVYGKLGIRSRAELGAWLATMDRDSPVSSDG